MNAMMKREIKRYFSTPIGYIFMTAVLIIGGIYFALVNLGEMKSPEIAPLFSFLAVIMIFLIPIHTMHLLAEERKNKTDQLLLTAPVNLSSIVIGKFLASVWVVVVTLLIALVYAVILIAFGKPSIIMLLGHYVGFLLLVATYIAIGLWISSLTENQIVSAVISFVTMIFLGLMMGWIAQSIANPIVAQIVSYLTPATHFSNFAIGKFVLTDLVYYLSMITLFLFLTVRSLEKRRWS